VACDTANPAPGLAVVAADEDWAYGRIAPGASIELAAGDRPETSDVRFWKLDIGRGGSGATSEWPVTRRRVSTIWLSREALLESKTFVPGPFSLNGRRLAQIVAAIGTSSHHSWGCRRPKAETTDGKVGSSQRVVTPTRKAASAKSLCTLNAPCGRRNQVQLSARDLSRSRPRSCPGYERDGILVPPTG
jgi:hypothetical protein